MAPGYTIRKAAPSDIKELADCFNRSFSDYYVPMELDEAHLRQFIDINDISLGLSVVAEASDGRMVGHSLTGRRSDLAWVGGAGVLPEHRRKGLASAMVSAQIASLRAEGISSIRLEVITQNIRAKPMYLKLGFKIVRDLHYFRLQRPEPEEVSLPSDMQFEPCGVAQALEIYGPDHPWQSMKESVSRLSDAKAFLSFSQGGGSYVEELGLKLPDIPEGQDATGQAGSELEGYCIYRDLEKAIAVVDLYSASNPAGLMKNLILLSNGKPIIASHVFNQAAIDAYAELGFERYIMQHEMATDL